MRWLVIVVLLCPSLVAETLTVSGETGAWRFSFRVPAEAVAGPTAALGHSDFQAWHDGRAVATTRHKVEFTRGVWGYTLTIQPNDTAGRFTIFNHTSVGELWFPSRADVVRFRPGRYRFGEGHGVGQGGATATLRIDGELAESGSERDASSLALLVAGLLAGFWLTGGGRRPDDETQPLTEARVGPGHGD